MIKVEPETALVGLAVKIPEGQGHDPYRTGTSPDRPPGASDRSRAPAAASAAGPGGSSPTSSRTRVPPRLLEPADAAARRPGEGPALVPEQLALGQLAGERPAVDRHVTVPPAEGRARAETRANSSLPVPVSPSPGAPTPWLGAMRTVRCDTASRLGSRPRTALRAGISARRHRHRPGCRTGPHRVAGPARISAVGRGQVGLPQPGSGAHSYRPSRPDGPPCPRRPPRGQGRTPDRGGTEP